MYMNGMFMFQAIVVIVNIKILIHSSIHSWLSLFFQFGSILVFYLAYGILAMPALDQIITGTFNMLLTLFTNWMVLFFLTLSYTLLEYISKVMYDNLHNIYKYQQMIEEEHKRQELEVLKANRKEKKTMYIRKYNFLSFILMFIFRSWLRFRRRGRT